MQILQSGGYLRVAANASQEQAEPEGACCLTG